MVVRERKKEARDSLFFFFSSRRRHTRFDCDWSSDVCSSDLNRRESGSLLTSNARRLQTNTVLPEMRCAETVVPRPSMLRSEERRVGKECRSRGWPYE